MPYIEIEVRPSTQYVDVSPRFTFINTREDMQWLRDVHLAQLEEDFVEKYQSAIICGNEDCPDKIAIFESDDPMITDSPRVFVRRGDDTE